MVSQALPIWPRLNELQSLLQSSQVVVVAGPTGSGKSTEVPLLCVRTLVDSKKAGDVICTQPRRVAACSLAQRVSGLVNERSPESEPRLPNGLDGKLGGTVGFQVRFHNSSGKSTRLKFVTDGILLRQMMFDKKLKSTSFVIIDEAHERTVRSDLILAQLRTLLERRKDMKLIIMSATMDTALFLDTFKRYKPKLFIVEGRTYPILNHSLQAPNGDPLALMASVIKQIHISYPPGGILCFLPGRSEIQSVQEELEKWNVQWDPVRNAFRRRQLGSVDKRRAAKRGIRLPTPLLPIASDFVRSMKHIDSVSRCPPGRHSKLNGTGHFVHHELVRRMDVLPLHAQLSLEQQSEVFSTSDGRRVVLATNVAETSITVPDVRYVLDCCLQRVKLYYPELGIQSLVVGNSSKAQSLQRSGRCGRTSSGCSFRLLSASQFELLDERMTAEVHRCDLTAEILHLIKIGKDPETFEWLEAPPRKNLLAALATLWNLGMIDKHKHIIKEGSSSLAIAMPVAPILSHLLWRCLVNNCSKEGLATVAMLEADVRFCTLEWSGRRRFVETFGCPDSDHMTLVNILNAFEECQDRKAVARISGIEVGKLKQACALRRKLKQILGDFWNKNVKRLPQGTRGADSSCRPERSFALRGGSRYVSGDNEGEEEQLETQQWWDPLRKSVTEALWQTVAVIDDKGGEGRRGYTCLYSGVNLKIHPTSVLGDGITLVGREPQGGVRSAVWHPPHMVFSSVLHTSQIYASLGTAVDLEWCANLPGVKSNRVNPDD